MSSYPKVSPAPEVDQVPRVHQGGWQPRHQGEPQVLEVDPHGPGRELGLLGRGHEVDRELLPRLELGTQPHLHTKMKQTQTKFSTVI